MDAQHGSGAIQVDYGLKSTLIQYLMTVIANTPVLASGMTLGFSGVALPYMTVPNDVLFVDKYQASWIASLATMSTPFGCLVSGPIIDRFGRKWAITLVNFPALLGWLCITINPSLYQVYLGRLLTGFSVGLSSTPAAIYSAEIATPSLRSYLVVSTSVSISLGVAVVYILGLIFKENWLAVAGVCCAFPVVSTLLTLLILPESPSWLMTRGKREKALKSLRILRGKSSEEHVSTEFNELAENSRVARIKGTSGLVSNLKSLGNPQAYKPLIVMNLFFFFQQMSGTFVVIFYAVDVVKEAGVTADPFVIAVLIGIMRLLVTVLSAWMSKTLGRRLTSLISGLGMTISLGILATHLWLVQSSVTAPVIYESSENVTININSSVNATDLNTHDSILSTVPAVTILTFIAASTIGFLTLPWAMLGEVFPTKVRGIAGGLTACFAYSVSFVTLKTYPLMLDFLPKHGVFYFYGGVSLLGTAFVFFFLPETEGKTLAQIEEYYARTAPSKREDSSRLCSVNRVIIEPVS